ncbi:MAG: DHA2 family efflux MFS transporter permease subunit [Chloroflexi bacterium]|nr:MAG: DHA2 family efflux MFS transporter permease subunit [Chloroflexota bacterium]
MEATPLAPRARSAVLGAVLLVLFLSSLDQTIVGTALPHIVSELKGDNLYTWVVTAYLLTSTVTVPIYGKLSDVYGRRPMLLIGVSIFLVGSALSGLSQSMGQLIAFRGVQGLGAGALFPISLAIIGDLFSPQERGRYQGLFGAVFGLSFIIGPFLGGFLTDNVNWRWVFYVNLPVGIAALAVIFAVLPNMGRRPSSVRDLDYAGIALLTASLVPLLIGLTEKGQTAPDGQLYGWLTWQVGGLILVSLVLLVAFILVERRAREPVIPLDLFTNRTMAGTNAAVFCLGFGMFTAVIYLPRFYQVVRGVSATQSGYEIWPLLVGLMGGSILAGQLISRTGKYKALMLIAIGILIVGAYLMTHMEVDTNNWLLWSWMLVLGAGIGPGMAAYTVVIQSVAPLKRMGVATSTLTLLRQLGGSVSLAIAGTLFNSTFTQQLPSSLAAQGVPGPVANQLAAAARNGSLASLGGASQIAQSPQLQALVPKILAAVHEAEALAIAQLFWLTVGAAAVAFLFTLLIEEKPLRSGPALRQEQLDELAASGAEPGVPAAAATLAP